MSLKSGCLITFSWLLTCSTGLLTGGLHSASGDGTYSDLCERRLVFELSNHPSPSQATRSLIHRISESSAKGKGFLTLAQLGDVFRSVDLRMSSAEVESLALGFASNGAGGVDAAELCAAIQSLMYNVLGQHSQSSNDMNTSRSLGAADAGNGLDPKTAPITQLLVEICEGILIHDRAVILGSADVTGDGSGEIPALLYHNTQECVL